MRPGLVRSPRGRSRPLWTFVCGRCVSVARYCRYITFDTCSGSVLSVTFHVHPTECLIRRLASFCAFSRAHGYLGEEGHCAVWPPSVEPARRGVSYDIPPHLLVALPACLQVMHVRASRSSKTGPVFLRCIRLPEKQIAVGKAMGTSESNPPMRGLLRCRRVSAP